MVAILIGAWLCWITLANAQLRPPRIIEHPADVLVKKQDPATLNCKAEGNPQPSIEWYHDGYLVEKSSERIQLNTDSLFFLRVSQNKREHDTGVYWCEASNEIGRVRSRNATLEVAVLKDEFRLHPKNVKAAMGESATLQCIPPKGYPEPNVRWEKDGEVISTNKGRFRLSLPGDLVISNVMQSDQGLYRCLADNIIGQRASSPATMTVHVKPFFLREPEHVTVLANEDVEFECGVGGEPFPTITWRRQDGKMPVGRAQIQENKSLLIRDVSSSDEGTYICEAENTVGIVSASVSLTVHSRPLFLVTPRDQRVGLNGIAKFECTATGNPPPSVFWTKEGEQMLMFPERTYGKFSVAREGTLMISGVSKEDKGYYICSVLSGIGSSMAKAYLDVTAVGDLPPPIILLGPANQTLPLNTVAMLPCEATGSPTPSIRWSVNSGPLPNNAPRFLVLDSGTLQIDDLQPTDSGIYSCTASSESGETSWSASLSVESPRNPNAIFHRSPDPSTFPRPPGQPTAVNITETSVTLSWQKSSNPGSSPLIGYRVEYYSSDLQSGWVATAHHVTTESHVVHNLRPDTHYIFIVRAENSHGLGQPSPASKVLKTQGLPPHMLPDYDLEEARVQLSTIVVELQDIRPISSTAVKLFWKIHGASQHIEGFYIRLKDLSSGSQKYNMVTVFNGGASSYVLGDLRKYTMYEFFLVPFYKKVEGPPSNSQSAQTLEDAPSAPPDNLHAEVMGLNSATIHWSSPPPQHINGGLKGYRIQVYDNNSVLHSNLSVNGTSTSVTLKNLSSGVQYKVKAEAFTQAGIGPSTKFIKLFIDPHMIGKFEGDLSRRSSTFHGVVQQPWFIALLGSFVFLLLSVFLVGVFLRRRLAWKKALGVQLNVPMHKTDGVRGVNSCETLWINQTLSSNHAEKVNTAESKMIDKPDSSMEHNYYSVCAPDYAEVDTHNMASFYKRDLPCVLAPYATTTLINTAKQGSGSVYESKSSGSEMSKKSDMLHDLSTRIGEVSDDQLLNSKGQYHQTGQGSFISLDEYGNQGRKLKTQLLHGSTSRAPVVNWSDIMPPPSADKPMSEQHYQSTGVKQPSPWSTLGRTGLDTDMGNPMGIFGVKHGSLMPQRTLPQSLSVAERNMQSTMAALMGAHAQGLGRRVSQNGMVATTSGVPFAYFLKPSTSDIIPQKHSGGTVLQNPANISNANLLEEGERIELNNIFSNRVSFSDDSANSRNAGPFFENNHPSGINEYSNNFFIAEYHAGKAQTSVRNRSSRPPSSYSNDSSSGTVPSRSRQNWKDLEKTAADKPQATDDIPSYNKPSFPTCSGSQNSVGRKRWEMKGLVGELVPLAAFADASGKSDGNTSSDTKEENDSTEDKS